MLYEQDGFTQSLGPNLTAIHYNIWNGSTDRFTVEISHMSNMGNAPYSIEIVDDLLEELVLEDAHYPTLDEAKAFVDGYLAANAD